MTRCFLPNPPHPTPPTPHTPTPSLGVVKGIRGGRAKGRGYTLPHRTPWAKGAVTQPIDPALPPSRPHCGLFYNLEPQFTAWLGNQTPRSPSHRSLSHMELLLIPTYFFFFLDTASPHPIATKSEAQQPLILDGGCSPSACLACRCNPILHQLICSLSRQTWALTAVRVCVQVGMLTLLSSLCPKVSGFLA